jgi:hypothetical protein
MIHTSVGGDITSTNSKFEGAWPPAEAKGPGVSLLGTLVELRNHSVQDSAGKHHRCKSPSYFTLFYIETVVALVIDVEIFRTRKFDAEGKEIETSFAIEKLVGKGHLNKFGIEI